MLADKTIVAFAIIIFVYAPYSYADRYGINEQIQESYVAEDEERCNHDPSCMKYANLLYQQELQKKLQRESEEARLKQDDPIGFLLLYLNRIFILIVVFVGVVGFYGLVLRLIFGKDNNENN